MSAVTPQQIHQQAGRVPAASQATNIEQARAIAEVQAMFLVAKQAPRDEGQAMRRALAACSEYSVASRAFFSFPRGNEAVTGESIVLATELARCWGNIDYGIMELARDDVAGHTEMLAFARDLETNTRSSQTFIVPHARDTRNGRRPLNDMRDIYENNANNGARRLRECIFRVLPSYVKNAAADRCREVLEKGQGDVPLPQRIANAIEVFSGIGINIDRLAAKHGPTSKWTGVEIANLEIAFRSIRRGETSADEAFPAVETTAAVTDEVRKSVARGKAAKAEPQADADPAPAESTDTLVEWIEHETRLRDAVFLAADEDALKEAEADFLKVAKLFPDKERAAMQAEIDKAFKDLQG
ncbi:UNVERIFIED_ORG: hypothetical protein M2348_001294 [Sphingomonas sp. R1F5B]